MVAKSCPLKHVSMKNIFEKKFLVEMFYGCKIVFSKTGLNEKKFAKNCFVESVFGCKIISSKTGLFENIFEKKVMVEYFLWLQNHFLENSFERKLFGKYFWSRIFMVA